MPGVTLTFVLADGPGDGLRNPVSTVTPSSSMVDFFSGASPLLPQAQFRLIVASNRVRLEDLVTEHELGDSSEVVARRVAGYLDLVASIALPLAYLLFILVYLLQFEAASMIQRPSARWRGAGRRRRAGRSIQRQTDFRIDGVERDTTAQLRAQVPLDGRGPLQRDEVRPRVAARRRDVEVLLPEGPRTGIDNSVVLN